MKRILSYLLWLANSKPPMTNRDGFYAMKSRLLRRYGTRDGTDLQEIPGKPCFNCNGTGLTLGGYRAWTCRKCDGTGDYRAGFWCQLERWRLGGRVFHIPGPRLYKRPDGLVSFTGYVQHSAYVSYSAATEAAMWLALAFDRPLFRKMFRASKPAYWSWLPLHNLQRVVNTVAWPMRSWLAQCSCGRRLWRRGGWCICRRCEHRLNRGHAPRVIPATFFADTPTPDEVPF
jgi:hypothetical protein